MQKDGYLRLGAFVFFVALVGGYIFLRANDVGLHFIVILAVSALLGILAGYASYRRGVRITARLLEKDRAERKAYKDRKLAEFVESKSK